MPAPSVINALIGSQATRSSADSDGPNVGDRLVVKVLRFAGSQRSIVSFGKFTVLADIDFPVRAGDLLQVVVTQKNSGRIRFQVEDPARQTPMQSGLLRLPNILLPEVPVAGDQRTVGYMAESLPGVLTLPASLPFGEVMQLRAEIAKILLADPSQSENSKIPASILQSLANIRRGITPLEINRPGLQLVADLKTSVENAGFLFEKKLELLVRQLWGHTLLHTSGNFHEHAEIQSLMNADLKPNLMKLKTFLDGLELLTAKGGSVHLRFVHRLLDSLLQHIHHQQSRAVTLKHAFDTRHEAVYLPAIDPSTQHVRTEPVQVFTYEFPLKEAKENARLKVYYAPRRARKKAGGRRLSLLLCMPRMGDIRTDFFLYRKNLDITFFVHRAETKVRISRQLPRIIPVLEPLFTNLNVKVVVSARKVDAFETEDLAVRTNRVVDYRA